MSLPVHAPVHSAKSLWGVPCAVSVTIERAANTCSHSPGHWMPLATELTEPAPVTATATRLSKSAEVSVNFCMGNVHGLPCAAHAPRQRAKVPPAQGNPCTLPMQKFTETSADF